MNLTVPVLAVVMLVGGFGGGYAGNGWMPDVEAASERHTGDRQDQDWDLYVKRDTVFMGGATILSLVAFGTGLSVLLTRNAAFYVDRGVKLLVVGITLAVVSSLVFMTIACCASGRWVQFTPFLLMLFVGALLVLFGYGHLLDVWFRNWRRDSPTGSPQSEDNPSG